MSFNSKNIIPKADLSEESDNDRWVISYADFITLLLSFFIAMYAISNVNVSKYKQAADSLEVAFKQKKKIKSTPTQPINQVEQGAQQLTQPANDLLNLAKILKFDLKDLIDNNLIDIKSEDEWIEISLKSNVLFASADAKLLSGAAVVLDPISLILKELPNPIRIEGFTDNVPIKNPLFESNWELSAARSSAVVRYFIKNDLPPDKFMVVGFADNFPVSDNSTLLGREENRRVNIVISKNESLSRLAAKQFKAVVAVEDPVIDIQPKQDYRKKLKTMFEENKDEIKKLQKLRVNGSIRYSNHPERMGDNE
jgi:chemotaxis protein MotB